MTGRATRTLLNCSWAGSWVCSAHNTARMRVKQRIATSVLVLVAIACGEGEVDPIVDPSPFDVDSWIFEGRPARAELDKLANGTEQERIEAAMHT